MLGNSISSSREVVAPSRERDRWRAALRSDPKMIGIHMDRHGLGVSQIETTALPTCVFPLDGLILWSPAARPTLALRACPSAGRATRLPSNVALQVRGCRCKCSARMSCKVGATGLALPGEELAAEAPYGEALLQRGNQRLLAPEASQAHQ